MVQIKRVDENADFVTIISQAYFEELDEFLVSDVVLLCVQELPLVVLFAVHLEHNVDVLVRHKEAFPVVLTGSLFNLALICYNNFFVVGLVVLPIAVAAESLLLLQRQVCLKLDS